MKIATILLALLLGGCATQQDYWQKMSDVVSQRGGQ